MSTVTVMYHEPSTLVVSVGRNGAARTFGVEAMFYERGDRRITLAPILRSGNVQNCSIDIPVDAFVELVRKLAKEGLIPKGVLE